ncbi:MAG: hypothetical protein ABSF54_27240 [Bryobacteraceae bacterium]|jgi:hypothetical protein
MKKANKNAVSASGSRTIINKSGAKEPCGATKSRQIRSEPLWTPFLSAKNASLGGKFEDVKRFLPDWLHLHQSSSPEPGDLSQFHDRK